jgi:hypothetical protein
MGLFDIKFSFWLNDETKTHACVIRARTSDQGEPSEGSS